MTEQSKSSEQGQAWQAEQEGLYTLLRGALERSLPGLSEQGSALLEASKQASRLAAGAYGEGRLAAEGAASWVTDGNESSESRQEKLLRLEQESAGELAEEGLLPSEPSLSGEYADSPTPRSLRAELTAGEELPELSEEESGELEELLSEAWELGCSERFEAACSEELQRWGALTREQLQERYGQGSGSGSAGAEYRERLGQGARYAEGSAELRQRSGASGSGSARLTFGAQGWRLS